MNTLSSRPRLPSVNPTVLRTSESNLLSSVSTKVEVVLNVKYALAETRVILRRRLERHEFTAGSGGINMQTLRYWDWPGLHLMTV
jgi:hypothetical protein